MIKSILALHTAHFLSSDPKHLSAHVWQNLECPYGTRTILALSAFQLMSHRLSVLEAGCRALADKDRGEPCKYSNAEVQLYLQFPYTRFAHFPHLYCLHAVSNSITPRFHTWYFTHCFHYLRIPDPIKCVTPPVFSITRAFSQPVCIDCWKILYSCLMNEKNCCKIFMKFVSEIFKLTWNCICFSLCSDSSEFIR